MMQRSFGSGGAYLYYLDQSIKNFYGGFGLNTVVSTAFNEI